MKPVSLPLLCVMDSQHSHTVAFLDKLWGKGKRREVVNDKLDPQYSANICTDVAGAVVAYTGERACTGV